MTLRIGIPRALLFYDYYPLWNGFFSALGYEVCPSPSSTEEIAKLGSMITVDEACFPVKLAHGHAKYLCDQGIDYLFVPRLVSVGQHTYICPKFMGLPDMMRQTFGPEVKILAPIIDFYRTNRSLLGTLRQVGRVLDISMVHLTRAYWKAYGDWRKYVYLMQLGMMPDNALNVLYHPERANLKVPPTSVNLVILGHPYNIYDSYLSMGITRWLEDKGVRIFTSDMLSSQELAKCRYHLPKKLFWSLGERVMGAAIYYAQQSDIHGLVQINSFGCGLESLIAELVQRHAAMVYNKPYLLLTVDEHTGQAGMVTRLEAFLDMIQRRQMYSENNLPSHG